jgi:hypothetical protein
MKTSRFGKETVKFLAIFDHPPCWHTEHATRNTDHVSCITSPASPHMPLTFICTIPLFPLSLSHCA